MMVLDIRVDDLSSSKIAEFLEQHIEEMKSVSPPESKHALDLDGLRKPEVTFWSVWSESKLVGCGAIKELNKSHAEIKSMRTDSKVRGKGVASKLLQHMLNICMERGYKQVSLETGSMDYFLPARALYQRFGFSYCEPFGDYKLDLNSVFMTKTFST